MSWKEYMKNTQYVLKEGGKKRGGEAGTTVRILLSVTKNTCFESTIYTQTALSGHIVNSIYFSNCPAKTSALYRQHLHGSLPCSVWVWG
jgi:hypothetical protein